MGGKKKSRRGRIAGLFVNLLMKPRIVISDIAFTLLVLIVDNTLYFRKIRNTKCILETFL